MNPWSRFDRLARLPATVWEFLLSPLPGLLSILLFTIALYAPSLNDWFVSDDFWFLRRSQTISWPTWLIQSLDYRNARPVSEFEQYRPLYLITFRAEYSLFGLHAAPYHIFNLVVHLGCIVLFWMLVLRLTKCIWATHLAALIFAVHFAYGDAIRWVVNGNTPLATLCYLAAFLLFVQYAGGGRRRYWHYGGFLVAFTAALLYHPVTMPLVVAIIAWYFLLHRKPRDVLRPDAWLPFIPLAIVIVPYVAIQESFRHHYPLSSIGFQTGWHMYDNYVDYLSLSAYPVDLQSSTAPYVSAVMFALCGFLLTQWRWSPLGVFAVIWYITALSPDSTLIFGAFGRLLYLPGLPLALVVTAVAMRLVDIASTGKLKYALARLQGALPYLGLVAIVLGALLVWKLQDIGSKNSPGVENTIGKQSDANYQLITELRRQFPTLPAGGTLYVANTPYNLIIFNDRPLDNLVELYYGEVDVKSVPLKDPPFLNQAQVLAALRPQDRLFAFERER